MWSIMKLSIFIWTASLLGLAHSEEEFGEFEDKVSILIKKLMDSKYLMSENESTLLKVSRSRNMKQKIYEILTSPKIQTNSPILNNCID